MSLSRRKRFSVFRRDNFTCLYCGRTPPAVVLEVDHVHPRSKGGDDSLPNLATSCFDCNRGKSNIPLSDRKRMAPDRAAIERVEEEAAQLRAYRRHLKKRDREIDSLIWDLHLAWNRAFDGTVKPDGALQCDAWWPAERTLRIFLKRLPVVTILDVIERTGEKLRGRSSGNRPRMYFYKVCWSKIRELEGERQHAEQADAS